MDESAEAKEKQGRPAEQPIARAPTTRRLHRSRKDRMIAGVAGGIGQYFDIDPILVRLAFVVLTLAGGSGILFYIVAWIIMPEATEAEDAVPAPAPASARVLAGAALVVVGAMILIQRVLPWFSDEVFWALVLIVIGAAVILGGTGRRVVH